MLIALGSRTYNIQLVEKTIIRHSLFALTKVINKISKSSLAIVKTTPIILLDYVVDIII
jgi:hypothetical protein